MDLIVEGRHALLFDDDATASFVNSLEALVPWNHDSSLLIDRYDVRHLLDRIPPRSTTSTRRHRLLDDACDADLLAKLDSERYGDLSCVDEERGELDPGTSEKSDAATLGAYQAVPFSYDEKNMYSVHDYAERNSGFRPPFEVPESLLNRLPPTEKLHQIIARTAIFVSKHGGQSEIVLRVKQGDNPTFGFLMPDHYLHAYFRYLVDHPQLWKPRTDCSKKEEKPNIYTSEAGALSLLGSVYGNGDDDAALPTVVKETEPHSLATVPSKSENGEALENEGAFNSASFADAATFSVSRKTRECSLLLEKEPVQSSDKGVVDLKPSSILEPPSDLKRTIEKIVEFIVRNGKQFETILIEQDRNFGRFPFLLSTNQYHSYYMKVFEEALELKLHGKSLSAQRNNAEAMEENQKKLGRKGKDADIGDMDMAELSEGGYNDRRRKEKFKMVFGGQKKDLRDQQFKSAMLSGLTTGEAAAAVKAATRGLTPPNAFHNKVTDGGDRSSKGSGATADEAAAIVMAATRGRSPANVPQNSRNDGRISSSDAIHGIKSNSKFSSGDIFGKPVLGLESIPHSATSSCSTTSDVMAATVLAKAAALATSREADSSEAALTKEQKLKAERLKRAKMFAALIKNGNGCQSDLNGSMETAGGSLPIGTMSKIVSIERDAEPKTESVNFDAEGLGEGLGKEHESRKRRRFRSRGHLDDFDDDKVIRTSHSSFEEKEDRRCRKHCSSSEESGHRKSSKHYRHRPRFHYCSSVDGNIEQQSEKHLKKHHRSRLNRKQESEARSSVESMEYHCEEASDATEIPNDLRAKIRAMLLEIL